MPYSSPLALCTVTMVTASPSLWESKLTSLDRVFRVFSRPLALEPLDEGLRRELVFEAHLMEEALSSGSGW